jgi:hypothetical protein
MTDSTYGSTATADRSTTEQVNDQVRDKAQLAQDKAQGALGQARSRFRDQIDQRSTQAGEQVQSTAQDVRSMAEQLRGQGKDTPARVAEQVADRAESFGSYLRDADGERLLRDVEDVARRQPWLVAAGGLALGFAASRFLKASSSRRYQTGDDRSSAGHSVDDATWGHRSPVHLHPGRQRLRDPVYPNRRGRAGRWQQPFGHPAHHASHRAQRTLWQPPRPQPTAMTVGRRP